MPAPETPQHHLLVHQLLRHAHTLLAAADNDEALPLARLLALAVDRMPALDRANLDAPDLAWAVAEAAVQVLACTRTPIRPQDPNWASCIRALDQLPLAARTGLLAVAVRRTTRDPGNAEPPVPDVPPQGGNRAAQRRAAGHCPCPCNGGGFCGGCGHAGCGARRRSTR